MGTEKFTKVKPAVGHGEHVKLASQAWGDPVTGTARVESLLRPNVEQAGLFSTAPYRPPPNRYRGEGTCEANNNTCKAAAVRGTRRCYFHSQGKDDAGSGSS